MVSRFDRLLVIGYNIIAFIFEEDRDVVVYNLPVHRQKAA